MLPLLRQPSSSSVWRTTPLLFDFLAPSIMPAHCRHYRVSNETPAVSVERERSNGKKEGIAKAAKSTSVEAAGVTGSKPASPYRNVNSPAGLRRIQSRSNAPVSTSPSSTSRLPSSSTNVPPSTRPTTASIALTRARIARDGQFHKQGRDSEGTRVVRSSRENEERNEGMRAPAMSRVGSTLQDNRRQSMHKRHPDLKVDPISLLSHLRNAHTPSSRNQVDGELYQQQSSSSSSHDTISGHNTAILAILKGLGQPNGSGFNLAFNQGWRVLRAKGLAGSIPLAQRLRLVDLAMRYAGSDATWADVRDLILHVAGEENAMTGTATWSWHESTKGIEGASRVVDVFESIMRDEHLEAGNLKLRDGNKVILTDLSPRQRTMDNLAIPIRFFLAYIAARSLLHTSTTPFKDVLPSLLHSRFPPLRRLTTQSDFVKTLELSPDSYTPDAISLARQWIAQVSLAQLWSREEGSGLGVIRVALAALRKNELLTIWSIWEAIREGSETGSRVRWIENAWVERKGYLIKDKSTLEIDFDDLKQNPSPSRIEAASSDIESPSPTPAPTSTHTLALIPRTPLLDYIAPSAQLTEAILAPFLSGFTRARLFNEAGAIWTWLATREPALIPGVVSWTALLQGYATSQSGASGLVESIEETWNEMKKSGVDPDGRAWGSRIDGWFNARDWKGAMKLVAELMKKKELVMLDGKVRSTLYARIVLGLLKNGQPGLAQETLEGMEQQGIVPTIELLNALMHYHTFGRQPDLPAIVSLLRKIANYDSLEPDVFTFTIILQALLKSNQKEATKQLIKIMEMTGVKPSVTTYGMVIGSLCRGSTNQGATSGDLVAAVELLDEMERSRIGSNEIVYTAIIQGFLNAMSSSSAVQLPDISALSLSSSITLDDTSVSGLHPYFVAALTIRKRMFDRGFVLNRVGANAIIKTALSLQTRGGVELAIRVFDDLRRSVSSSLERRVIESAAAEVDEKVEGERDGVGSRADTWYVLINGFVQMGDWARARKLVEEMIREGFVVKSRNLKTLVNTVLRGGR